MGRKDDEPKGKEPFYRTLVRDILKIHDGLDIKPYKETIIKWLEGVPVDTNWLAYFGRKTATEVERPIFLADSINILSWKRSGIQENPLLSSEELMARFPDSDLSTVAAVATLRHIFDYGKVNWGEEFKKLSSNVHEKLDRVNWMIGTEAMKELEIQPITLPEF
jgi:hypothetical protein